MENKDAISKKILTSYFIIKRFPYVACDMLAAETDYVLSCFFPEPNLNNMDEE